MLKKPILVILSNMIALMVFTTSAFAAPHEDKASNEHKSTEAVTKGTKKETKKETSGDKGKVKPVIKEDTKGTVTSVTYDTYGGHKGDRGLLRAFENVKDKPAGQIIAALLLKKYGITVTSVTYSTYGQASNEAADFSDFAATLEASGEIESAADLQ